MASRLLRAARAKLWAMVERGDLPALVTVDARLSAAIWNLEAIRDHQAEEDGR